MKASEHIIKLHYGLQCRRKLNPNYEKVSPITPIAFNIHCRRNCHCTFFIFKGMVA